MKSRIRRSGESDSELFAGLNGRMRIRPRIIQVLRSSPVTPPAAVTIVTTAAVTPTPTPTDGPQVTQVLRYGYHWMPTTVVVTFNQALDPATAQDAHDYTIIGPEHRRIHVKSAEYDASTNTVTLHPSRRINIHYRYELIVDGTAPNGLENLNGLLLDGIGSGQPGSAYRAPLTWRNLVLDPKEAKAVHRTKSTTRRSLKVKSEPATHSSGHETAPFTRKRAFRR